MHLIHRPSYLYMVSSDRHRYLFTESIVSFYSARTSIDKDGPAIGKPMELTQVSFAEEYCDASW